MGTRKEKLVLRDHLEIEHIRKGNKKLVHEADDLIVNVGKTAIAERIYGVTADAFTYVAIGTDNTAAAAAQTTLIAEITTGGGERASATTTIVDSYTAQIENTFSFTASHAVVESGVFNDATANLGDMLCRQTFGAVNVVSGDALIMRWKVTVA